MGAEKKKAKEGGGFRWGSALIWAGGQFCVNWFITYTYYIWATASACASAFVTGWVTSAILGRFAKWGANALVMAILGVLIGVAVFSGAFTGLSSAPEWWQARQITVNWDKLQTMLLSPTAAPPAILGLLTGLYVR